MVSTRSKKTDEPQAGDKRSAPTDSAPAKKPKTKDGHLQANDNGEIGLKNETKEESGEGEKGEETVKVQYRSGDTEEISQEEKAKRDEKDQKAREVEQERGKPQEATDTQQSEVQRSGKGESKQEGDEIDLKEEDVAGELEEPKHGTLESGHVYFLYRPKIDVDEVDSIDDVSKFHILLIPNSPPYDKGHYHRIIEVGKKRLPDPNAKRSVMWGLVGSTGEDRSKLKDAFGAYDYDTKTRGKRHQPAARPAARGHYILHSPRDEKADDPSTDRQRDFKLLLAYEITTPVHEDFGAVQKELGIEEKGAVLLQVKDPDVESGGNPRAASLPRDKRAQYPPGLKELFGSRRWIPANPPSLLNYSGAEVLVLTSPHELADSLGKDGEKVEDDLDKDAEQESVSIDEAMKELGMSKRDTEIEALEGEWA